MNKFLIVASLGLALATTACNESYRQDSADVSDSKGAIAKDNAAIANQNANLRENRAEKAAAKANGDYVTQAGESLSIGANKVAKGYKDVERSTDRKILEQDQYNVNH